MTDALNKSERQRKPARDRAVVIFLGLALAAGVLAPSHGARAAIGFVQANTGSCASCTATTVAFTANNTAGNLIVVSFDYSDSASFLSVTDTQGNVYVQAGSEVHQAGGSFPWKADIYYAKSIKGGANSVTVEVNGSVFIEVAIQEYSGLDQNSPLDATAGNTGNSATLDSGPATTHSTNELIFGWGPDGPGVTSAGAGFTLRTNAGGNITEDMTVASIGTYDATANASSGPWSMQMATFKAASPGIQVSSRSDILSNSQPSATSNHTVIFTVNKAIYGSSASNSSTLTLTLDPNFTIPAGMDCGDVDAATSVQFGFNYPACQATATAWGFSAMGSVITLVPPSGTGVYVPTSTQVTIKIGSNATVGQQGAHWITNPSAAGVYTISVGGTFGGSGNMLVAIQSGVTVSAIIPESLSLSVSSISALGCTADDGATVNSVSATGPLVAFGNLSANAFYQGCQDLIVSTNAGNGYSLTMQESSAMRTADGRFTIPDTTCDAGDCSVVTATTWVTPTKNGFGHTCANQSGSDCNPTYGNGKKFKPVSNIAAGNNGGTINFVQANTGGTCLSCTSNTTAFTSANTAGNLIAVAITYDDTVSLTSVTDTQGNVYVRAGTEVDRSSGGNPQKADIYYAKNIKGGANAVTAQLNGPSNNVFFEVYVHEYSGLDPTSPLDVTASSTGNSTNLDSGPATTNFANELIFGWGTMFNGSSMAAGTGFTPRENFGDEIVEDKVVSAVGTYDAVATNSLSNNWFMQMATFKAKQNVGQTLMSNTGTVTNSTGRVKYRLSVPSSQVAGTYTTLISYTIYATY